IHGMPTTFNPHNDDTIKDLMAMTAKSLSTTPVWICWMKPDNYNDLPYSSLILAMPDADSAQNAIERHIFWRGKLKCTEVPNPPKARCMNCLRIGHSVASCPHPHLCAYCGNDHLSQFCKERNAMKPKCTPCA
ncbi:hypothetical protein CROQUDRAFT_53548, partial [Cronartium quercuum f. sp. fusiforme G11]